MIKFKNAKFSETAFKLTDEQRKEKNEKHAKKQNVRNICQSYITEARIESYLSKHNVDNLPKSAVTDIITDAFTDYVGEIPLFEFRKIVSFKVEGLLKKCLSACKS